MNEKLVLHEREFFGAKSIKTIAVINDTFQLGVDADLAALGKSIHDVLSTLHNPNIGDANSLLHVALAKQSKGPSKDRRSSTPVADVWREIGYPDIALIFEDWYALADDAKIKVIYKGTDDEHPTVSNAGVINKKCGELNRRLGPLVEDLPFTPNDIHQIVCNRLTNSEIIGLIAF